MAQLDFLRPQSPSVPKLTPRVVGGTLAFLLWLVLGYAAILWRVGELSLGTALWQGALYLVAVPFLLLLVVLLVSLPKPFHKVLPRPVLAGFWIFGGLSELFAPWLGWSLLIWLLNAHTPRALALGGELALFSYLTGVAIMVVFGPRPRTVQITTLDLPIAGLPAAFDGYRILHVSDLHISYYFSARQARARLARAAGLEPDLVVFTGDLTGERERLEGAADALATLRGRDGAVAVLGNHDNWLGAPRVMESLWHRGVRPLVNSSLAIARGGEHLYIVGVDNAAYTARDDLSTALQGIGEEATVILLSHAPEIVLRPLALRAAVILAGHTHGGQVVLPLLGPLHVPSKLGRHHASGLYATPTGWLFITRGLGEVFPPLRVLCPPEIAHLTLRRAK
jgi:predicted MPP superfamily phosphohydrolase